MHGTLERNLKSYYDKNPSLCVKHFTESIRKGEIKGSELRIRPVAEAIMGREWVDNLNEKRGKLFKSHMMESDAVRYSDFNEITGQIFFSIVDEGYNSEEFVFTSLVPTIHSDIADMEKIPGISTMGDEAEVVGEADAYPFVGVSEDYYLVAEKQKRGFIVPLTKEAIAFDKTGMLVERCRETGKFLGLNKEKRIIDCIIDENDGAKSPTLGGHRYNWRGTDYATYQTTTPWINVKTSNGLTDYTDVENSWLLLTQMKDPFTDEPVEFNPNTLIVTPQNVWTASRILNSVETRRGDGSSGGVQTINEGNVVNMVNGPVKLVWSRQLESRAATDTDWWFGDPSVAFAYFSNWDILTEEAPDGSHDMFHRDIVQQFKVSEKGVAATRQPRAMCENRA